MSNPRTQLIGRRPSRLATSADARGGPEPDTLDDDSPLTLTRRRTEWANELTTLLRTEICGAVGCGLINAGESEQLLARFLIVVDQALATR